MCAKFLGFVLFACQIILNGSHVIAEATDDEMNVTSTLAPTPAALPEGYVTFPDLHAAYKVHKTSVTWKRARDRCIAEGAYLAIADTMEKIERIYSTQSKVDNWISVGIRKPINSNEWVRIDNDLPLTSLPWTDNFPVTHYDCVAISFSGKSLVSTHCTLNRNWYVCEISI